MILAVPAFWQQGSFPPNIFRLTSRTAFFSAFIGRFSSRANGARVPDPRGVSAETHRVGVAVSDPGRRTRPCRFGPNGAEPSTQRKEITLHRPKF